MVVRQPCSRVAREDSGEGYIFKLDSRFVVLCLVLVICKFGDYWFGDYWYFFWFHLHTDHLGHLTNDFIGWNTYILGNAVEFERDFAGGCTVSTRPSFPVGLQCHSFVALRLFLHVQVPVPKKRHICFGLLNLSLAFRLRHCSSR